MSRLDALRVLLSGDAAIRRPLIGEADHLGVFRH